MGGNWDKMYALKSGIIITVESGALPSCNFDQQSAKLKKLKEGCGSW